MMKGQSSQWQGQDDQRDYPHATLSHHFRLYIHGYLPKAAASDKTGLPFSQPSGDPEQPSRYPKTPISCWYVP